MEDITKSLITINASLAKIEKQIAIGEKILVLKINISEREKIIKFLLDNVDLSVLLISRYYDLKNYQLEKFKNQLDWRSIEYNTNTNWTVEFIEKFGSKLDWESPKFVENQDIVWSIELVYVVMQKFKYGFNGMLIRNVKLPWVEIMTKYKKAISWDILNDWHLPMPEEIIELHKEKLDWKKTSRNSAVATHPWSLEFMEKYSNKWDWYDLSNNQSLPWSIQLIEKFVDKWDWHSLSYNTSILWTSDFIEKHKERWFWPALSGNISLPWSEEFIEKFIKKWSWSDLSENNTLPWTQKLVEKYDEKWHWARLSRNTKLPLTENLILKYIDKWHWNDLISNNSFPSRMEFIVKLLDGWKQCYLSPLFNSRNFPWSIELFEYFKEKIMLDNVSYHKGIILSMEIIDKYPSFWNWRSLSQNESIIWTDDLIEKYKDKWHWEGLSQNKNFPWSFKLFQKYSNMYLIDTPMFFSYDFIYEKIFKEHLNDKIVDEVMDVIQNQKKRNL